MAYTTSELLASVKRRANIPTASGVFGDSELLAIATEELRSYIVPLVLKEREDYWLANYDVTLTAATSYHLPTRAVGGKLRELTALDSSGREFNIPRVSPADLAGARVGFYLDGRGIRLFLRDNAPPTTLGVTLRMRYFLRPGVLVLPAAAGVIQTISTLGGLTNALLTASSGWATLTSGGPFDVVSYRSPFGVVAAGATGAIAAQTWGVAGADVTALSVGDWVCMEDQSPVVQAPVEFHDLLAQKVAIKVFESKGMTEKLGSAREELSRMEGDARALISPRVDGETQRAVARGGLFRARW